MKITFHLHQQIDITNERLIKRLQYLGVQSGVYRRIRRWLIGCQPHSHLTHSL